MEQQKEQISIMKAKIKNSWIYKNNWVIGVAIIAIIAMIGYYERYYKTKHGIYTIGHIYHVEGARGGLLFRYYYYYEGEKYESEAIGSHRRKDLENKRFYVQFLVNNPKGDIIHTDKPVPSCIKKVPFDGWETIPTKCDD